MGNEFGKLFSIATFGESHGSKIGVVVDGCPPLLPISVEEIQKDLNRRRPGQSHITTPRQESDQVEIYSGIFEGKTLGTPIAMGISNKDAKSGDYEHLKDVFRPGHADYTTHIKYGIRDYRGGGRASARETAGRVAAGAIARKLLAHTENIEVLAWVSQIGKHTALIEPQEVTPEQIEATPTRCPNPESAEKFIAAIENARADGDSLGGVITCCARGVPPGLGEPVFDKLDAELAKAIVSLPAVKGVGIGSGFASATMTGKEHNDPFIQQGDLPQTTSNFSGGIQGGISNGENIILQIAFKPTSTIASAQQTVDKAGNAVTLEAKGRHDPCVLPRAIPVVEAMVCLVLADHWLRQLATAALQK